MRTYLFAILMAAAACQQAKSKLDDPDPNGHKGHVTAVGSGSGSAVPDDAIDIDSKDILARAPVGQEVQVKHVLIGWGGARRQDLSRSDRCSCEEAEQRRCGEARAGHPGAAQG